MQLRELKLSCWRNFTQAQVEFGPGLNFVIGPNGAGKTNLLEAVAYLGQVRSFRRALDRDLITSGEKEASISGLFSLESQVYTRQVDIRITPSVKAVSLDGKRMKTLSSYFGNVSVISFDPRKVFLFRGEPSERRRALDEALSAIYPKYLYSLSRYKRILKQRNQALQQGSDDDILSVYSREIITCAYRLISDRADLIRRVNQTAGELFERLFGPGVKLELSYRTNMPVNADFDTFRDEARELFERKRSAERIRRSTVVGPHLDDVICTLDSKPIQVYGSQGQNRLASLSFVLALARAIGEARKENPILVLDDVLSDLDGERREKLIRESTTLGQTIISGGLEEAPEGTRVIAVDNGAIKQTTEEA